MTQQLDKKSSTYHSFTTMDEDIKILRQNFVQATFDSATVEDQFSQVEEDEISLKSSDGSPSDNSARVAILGDRMCKENTPFLFSPIKITKPKRKSTTAGPAMKNAANAMLSPMHLSIHKEGTKENTSGSASLSATNPREFTFPSSPAMESMMNESMFEVEKVPFDSEPPIVVSPSNGGSPVELSGDENFESDIETEEVSPSNGGSPVESTGDDSFVSDIETEKISPSNGGSAVESLGDDSFVSDIETEEGDDEDEGNPRCDPTELGPADMSQDTVFEEQESTANAKEHLLRFSFGSDEASPCIEHFVKDLLDCLQNILEKSAPGDVVEVQKRLSALISHPEWSRLPQNFGHAELAINNLKKIESAHKAMVSSRSISFKALKDQVSCLCGKVCPADLSELYNKLNNYLASGNEIDGKDVILLIGASGSGKTTTLQHLAGTKFEEIEVDGSFHLKPVSYMSEKYERFKTSCSSSSVTRSTQVAEVSLDGESILICDTPGFFETVGPTQEIVNAVGVASAIARARSVKAVLVISKEEFGCGCHAFCESLVNTLGMFVHHDNEVVESVMSTFDYVFTKCEEVDKRLLTKKLEAIAKRQSRKESGNAFFVEFVTDMTEKTYPEAHVVRPLTDSPLELLRGIWDNNRIEDPGAVFDPGPPQEALLKLQDQLHFTNEMLKSALEVDDAEMAACRLMDLVRLNYVMGSEDVSNALERGMCAARVAIAACREKANNVANRLSTFQDPDHDEFEDLANHFRKYLTAADAYECFAKNDKLVRRLSPSHQFCRNTVSNVARAVGKVLLEIDFSEDDVDLTMVQTGSLVAKLNQLRILRVVLIACPGGTDAGLVYRQCCDDFSAVVCCIMRSIEEILPELSAENIQTVAQHGSFILDLLQDHSVYPEAGDSRDWEDIKKGSTIFMDEMKEKLETSIVRIKHTTTELLEALTANGDDSISVFLSLLENGKVGESRRLLETGASIKILSEMLPDLLDETVCKNLVESFDDFVVSYINWMGGKTHQKKTSITRAQDDAREELEALKAKLVRAINVCRKVRLWWKKPLKLFEEAVEKLVELNGGIDDNIRRLKRKAKKAEQAVNKVASLDIVAAISRVSRTRHNGVEYDQVTIQLGNNVFTVELRSEKGRNQVKGTLSKDGPTDHEFEEVHRWKRGCNTSYLFKMISNVKFLPCPVKGCCCAFPIQPSQEDYDDLPCYEMIYGNKKLYAVDDSLPMNGRSRFPAFNDYENHLVRCIPRHAENVYGNALTEAEWKQSVFPVLFGCFTCPIE